MSQRQIEPQLERVFKKISVEDPAEKHIDFFREYAEREEAVEFLTERLVELAERFEKGRVPEALMWGGVQAGSAVWSRGVGGGQAAG